MKRKSKQTKQTFGLWAWFNTFILRIHSRLASVIFFSLMFAIVGTLLPDFYFKYFDNRQYLKIDTATIVGGELNKCGYVDVELDRHALIDLQAKAIVEFVLVRADAPDTEVQRLVREVAISKGDKRVIQSYKLDCDIREGNYYLEGNVTYYVRDNQHITTWESNMFTIN